MNIAPSLPKDEDVMFVGEYYWRRKGQKTIGFKLWGVAVINRLGRLPCRVGSAHVGYLQGILELKKA